VIPFDRYATRKFAETLPIGRLGTLRVLFAVQQRLRISTRYLADIETTAQATFLANFMPIQRSVQIRQLSDGPKTNRRKRDFQKREVNRLKWWRLTG
jgi:hypothetical protein